MLRRGHVWTPSRPDATAILLTGDRIAWIGDEAGVAGLHATGSLSGVVVRDCEGALIAPSFVDAHVHLFATGLTTPDGVGVGSLAEVAGPAGLLDAVAGAAARLSEAEAVVGFGWDPARWADPELPDVARLRAAAGGREVFLGRIDMHSALVAVDAATSAGSTSPGTEGTSRISADGGGALLAWEQGSPAGIAFARLTADPRLRRRAVRSALTLFAAGGIGAVHEMAAPHLNPLSDLDLLTALDADPGTVRVLRWWGEHADAGGIARAEAAGALGCGGDLCVDGSIGSRTAALLEPYDDAPGTSGTLQLGADSIARHVRACVENRIGTGFHVIGDRAATAVTEGLLAASQQFGGRLPVPVRLEHAEMLPPSLLAVLAHLGVLASVQPGFQARWGVRDELYEQRLGRARTLGMNRLADLAAAGIPLAFGSDSPVVAPSGWAMVRDAVWHPEPSQRLSVRSAFAAATRGGWRAAGAPDRGVLLAGAPADLAVWDLAGGTSGSATAAAAGGITELPALEPVSSGRPLPALRALFVAGVEIALPDPVTLPSD